MKRGTFPLLSGVALIVALGVAAVGLQVARERRFPADAVAPELLYVQSPAVITRMALGFDALVADLYWIRTIQYYGSRRLSSNPTKNYDLLYPLLDRITSLDPYFTTAYRFGAFFLSEDKPGGAGRSDLAIRLLEKAMARHPERWEYPYDVGFVHYRHADYKTAADWFLRAADIPGSANWLRPLAAVTLTSGGDASSSRVLWRTLLESEVDWLRRTAEQRLTQLDAIDQIAQLESLTAEYERRYGNPPTSWEDMVRTGLLRGIPLDPAGHPYVLNPWWGDVTVSEQSPLWPLPTERPA